MEMSFVVLSNNARLRRLLTLRHCCQRSSVTCRATGGSLCTLNTVADTPAAAVWPKGAKMARKDDKQKADKPRLPFPKASEPKKLVPIRCPLPDHDKHSGMPLRFGTVVISARQQCALPRRHAPCA